MKLPFAILAALLLLPSLSLSSAALEPANPKANAKARALLTYLVNLEERHEKKILSGQFVDFGQPASLRLLNEIHDKTGEWPALMGVDYADFPTGGLTTAKPNRAAIDYAKAGGLVTVSAHLYNPARTNRGGLRDKGVDMLTLLTPGSEVHQRWMEELDTLAAGLQELKAAGVVVLWRPFHEMNGGWFWWGAQNPDSFIKVWRHMFDYFSHTKQLDNLLWVYGPNHGNKTADYYPGDHYADVVGLDAYTDFIDPQHIRGYPEIAALHKPFGFTEYGPHGSQNPPGDYDYTRFLAGLTNAFPRSVFFMSWNARWSLGSNRNTRELLASPLIINRDDLPPALSKSTD